MCPVRRRSPADDRRTLIITELHTVEVGQLGTIADGRAPSILSPP